MLYSSFFATIVINTKLVTTERSSSCLWRLDEDGTRQTGIRGTDRKVVGDRETATFRCHHPETHGHVTLYQPPALLLYKKLLNCNTVSLRTCSVFLSLLFRCVPLLDKYECVLVALVHSVMAVA